MYLRLRHQASLLERCVRATLLHGFETLSRNGNRYLFIEFGEKYGLGLEVDLAATLAGRVKFGGTRAVGVPACDAGSLSCYCACSCHSGAHGSIWGHDMQQILYFLILIFSIILHEVAHGYMADRLGDPTARYAGRLTLNPLPHIDMFGSVILPLLSILTPGSFLFGWAKPVPYNPYNLTRAPRWGEALVAAAGPATNFALALLFSLCIRMSTDSDFITICFIGVAVNVWLGILNLIPIPPLDGSKILPMILPRGLSNGYSQWRMRLEYNPFLGFGIVLLFFLLFGSTLSPLVYSLARAIAGV